MSSRMIPVRSRRTVPRTAAVAVLSVTLLAGALAGCNRQAGGAATPEATPPPTAVTWVPATCPPAPVLTRLTGGPAPAPSGSSGPTAPGSPSGPTVPGSTVAWPERPGLLPDGFRATWALRCVIGPKEYPGAGRWVVLAAERTEGPALAALLEELRAPRGGGDPGDACALWAWSPPYLVLVGADGRAVWPSFPVDGCGHPTSALMKALDAPSWRTLSEQRLSQMDSPEGVASGCSSRYKDVIAMVDAERRGAAPSAPPAGGLPAGADRVRVCVYQVDPASGSTPTGTFRSGGTLTGADAAFVLSRLRAAPPAGACTGRHTRFAVVTVEPATVYLELDGCRRYLADGSGYLGAPDPAVIPAVEKAHT